MPKNTIEFTPQYYDWDFEGEEREPIYVTSERAANGVKLAVLDNVTLQDGSKITVKIMPMKVTNSEFMSQLADSTGHESNVALICHLCVGWGDKDFVMPEDISSEINAVA